MLDHNNEFEKYSKAFDEQLIVSIDFDDTFSTNPIVWLRVVLLLKNSGFNVVCCTSRYENEYPEDLDILINNGIDVYYTGRKAKDEFLQEKGIKVDIWIDDNPFAILNDIK